MRGVFDARNAFIEKGSGRDAGRVRALDSFANDADNDDVLAVDLAFVRQHDDGASVATFHDDRRFAERFHFRARKVNGEILTTFGVPNEAVDFVRIRNENRSDRAADADASVPDRDVDGLLFEKFPNRVSKLIFHNILSFTR